jgi:hypothetical protein
MAIAEAARNQLGQLARKHDRWILSAVAGLIRTMFAKKVHRDTSRNYLLNLGFYTPRSNRGGL